MNQQKNRVVLGTIIVVFGVLSLIDNLHIFGMVDIFSFWPTVFILIGIVKILQTQNRSSYVIGVIFIALGGLLTLEHLGFLYFRARDLWPLLLIGAGVLVISKGWVEKEIRTHINNGVFNTRAANNGPTDNTNTLNIVAVMSGNNMRKDTQDFRGGEVTAVMGGVDIDLRQASIQNEAVLNVFATWGGIVLKVPADWTVVSNAIPILGGVDDRTVPPAVTTKRLVIEGYVVMGGVEIKN